MRYFKMILRASEHEIEEKSKIHLKTYAYESPVVAISSFMNKTMRNGLVFFIYRLEDNESALAAFCFDEKYEKYEKFENVYSYMMEHLKDACDIKRVKQEPYEITLFEYYECYNEAKRRDLISYGNNIFKDTVRWVIDYDLMNSKNRSVEFEERIVDVNKK